jgi:hypothetical protein
MGNGSSAQSLVQRCAVSKADGQRFAIEGPLPLYLISTGCEMEKNRLRKKLRGKGKFFP